MNKIWILALCLTQSCAKSGASTPTEISTETTLQRVQSRAAPEQTRAKLQVKMTSRPFDLAQSVPAVLIGDLPRRAHVALMGPLGGPVALMTADGVGMSIGLPRERHLLEAPEADQALRDATLGLLGLPDMLGLLVGRLPLDGTRVLRRQPLDEGRELVTLEGPSHSQITAMLDVDKAVPIALVVKDKKHTELFRASFEPFERDDLDRWVPTRLVIDVPALELHVDLRYKSWKDLDTLPPVFDLSAPDGWTTEPLKWALLDPLATSDEHP